MIGIGQASQGETQESQRNLLLAIDADPTSNAGRYALLRPWFGRLARGEEPPQRIRETLQSIEGTAAVAVQAWRAASQDNWAEVQALDDTLATVLPTDLWYLDTVKLRADWRIKSSQDMQPDAARQAVALIDEAIAIYQDPEFYSMRLVAAYVAGDTPEIIETARRLIYLFSKEMQLVEDGEIDPTMPMLQRKAQQVAAVRQLLSDVEHDERVSSYKVEELRGSVDRIIERLRAAAKGLSQ